LNELSLFTGAGGGLLGTHHLLGHNIIGMVEIDDYCQRVLKQRQLDGLLPECPIFGNIRTFIDSGCCELYRGITDVISAGFPCQPFSVAGKGEAEHDDRNMWPETVEVIRRVGPPIVFLENVPGLLSHEYALTIFRQLSENGYEALPPLILGADDVGAPHKRKRVWIVAYGSDVGCEGRAKT
jgi:DNA (cytosine-5)-methyltransferase 1